MPTATRLFDGLTSTAHSNQLSLQPKPFLNLPIAYWPTSLTPLRNALHLNTMIKSLKHKGLKRYYETGSTQGIQANHAARLRMQLAALDTATEISDLDIPGYALHPLKGQRKGTWSISVSGNWRLTFEFVDGNAYLLDYEDYH